jgi:Transglycosylase-like domain
VWPYPPVGGRPIRLLILTLVVLVVVALLVIARAATAKLTPERLAFWDRVARCETGGNWQMRGSTYSGGLGFYNGTWSWWARELGVVSRYPTANLAPRLVQIRVAEYGYRVHRGYWGCISNQRY